MLVAYFDESGTQRGSACVSVAGYISTENRWAKFQQQWKKVLRDYDLEYFHMSEFESRYGPYKNWPQETRVSLLKRLIGVIHRNTIMPVGAAALIEGYEEVRRRFSAGIEPYGFCFTETLKSMAEWSKTLRRPEPIACVLEAGAGFGGQVEEIRKSILKTESRKQYYRIASITFADKKDITPLQAADFLAYEAYKEADNGLVGTIEKKPVRRSFEALLTDQNVKYLKFCSKKTYFGEMGKISGLD
jgi:hypothetical protein